MDFNEVLSSVQETFYDGPVQQSDSARLNGITGNIPPNLGISENLIPDKSSGCPDLPVTFERRPTVKINLRNILPAIDAYDHPPVPPPFPRPVRWMVWSKPERDQESDGGGRPGSSNSFGEGDLTTVKGIKEISGRSVTLMQKKCDDLETQLRQITEKCQKEKARNIRLLETLTKAKDEKMNAVGNIIGENDSLEERIKDVTKRLTEMEEDSRKAAAEAEARREEKLRALLKVIKDRDENIEQLTSEIRYLRNFAEDKDRVEASVAALRIKAQNRYEQQQAELESIYQTQEQEQMKLQGLAADRLLALTEQSYDKALGNLDEETIAVFYKHCQVQDAINVWLERDKTLENEKAGLQAKLNHVICRRQTAMKYLKKANNKLQQIYNHVRLYDRACQEHHQDFDKNICKYEEEYSRMLPLVQRRLQERRTRLKELEHVKAVRRAEMMRLKLLEKIVSDECSTMEKAFVWAITYVMKAAQVDDVDDLAWKEREMVLRRVFVLMNMEIRNKRQTFQSLAQAAQNYALSLENDPQWQIQTIANRRAALEEESESLNEKKPLTDVWIKFGFLEG